MKATEHKSFVKVVLELEEGEARWLKGYLQNEMYHPESETDSMMRERFFNELHKIIEP